MRDTTRRGFLDGIAAVATVPAIGAADRVWRNVGVVDAETAEFAGGAGGTVLER
jgi:hypothetical protein